MTQRFHGYIHSIVGHQMMISPNNNVSEQYKCAGDDFESIMPADTGHTPGRFAFHVKRDRIGVEHYRQWLGLAKIENDRLGNLEQGLLGLIELVKSQPVSRDDSVEAMATRLFENRA